MRILGVDPGSQAMGWGLVEAVGGRTRLLAFGVHRAPRREGFPARLRRLYRALRETLREHRPDVVVVEEVFHGRNTRTVLRIGECRGVALLAAAETGASVVAYTARDVKKAVVGYGAATKAQMQWMMARTFRVAEAIPEDAADALALALTHSQRLLRHARKS